MPVDRRQEKACIREEAGWSSLSEAVNMPNVDTETDLQQVEDRATLEKLLPNLRERWQQVLRYRYYDGLTLEETGERLGVTTERARAIQGSALRALKKQIYKSEREGKPAW